MPTVLRISSLRFSSIVSKEQSHRIFIHVEQGHSVAKFWLEPVALASMRGFRSHELNRLRALVIEHRLTLLEAWNDHFRR